jgi:RNA polymerase sigma-70 factor (ECF subfamily)
MPEKERFDKIYAATFDRLYHFIKKNAPDKSSIKDTMQECYIRLWENLDEVTDDETIIALLRKYAINITINAIHKQQKDLQRNHVYYTDQPLTQNVEDQLHAKALLEKYRDALAALPAKRREVFILKREQGLSHKQIADMLGISIFTIDRHMNEALRALRDKLSADVLTVLFVLLEIQLLVK